VLCGGNNTQATGQGAQKEEAMLTIPVNAKVECADGACGETVTVVVDPTTVQITHVVVEEKGGEKAQRLVPLDLVADANPSLVTLTCTVEELSEMESFIETHFVETGPAPRSTPVYYDHYVYPYIVAEGSQLREVSEKRVPLGEKALHRGTELEAKDGPIGQLGELVVDPETREVTHLVVMEGHRLGKKEIMLPVSAIDFTLRDTIYFKLDKAAIEKLPTIPVKRRYATGEVNIDLVAKVFEDEAQATEALAKVEGLHRDKVIKLVHAAILVKDEDGNTSVKDIREIDAKKGRLVGAITGGLIGLLAGPVGAVVGALAGAGAGGLAGKWIDMGFSDKFLLGLQERMTPGSSALIILAEHEPAGKFEEILAETEGIMHYQELNDALVEQLVAESEGEN